jgi:2-keto-4-pentenoate hydratase/2-oxohepta-3-ene-1,7-dioic acid hydratase in catechol pathway
MRLATILGDGGMLAALVRDDGALPLELPAAELRSVRGLAGAGQAGLDLVRAWADRQPADAWRPLTDVVLGPAVPDPGAIYTIGHNYRAPGETPGETPGEAPGETPGETPRPLVYGKAASSVGAPGATLAWDRTVTDDVDAEVELGVVIGAPAFAVDPADALRHVFGYTVINDVSARDPHLDGDQWLLGKSLPGFCPVGPWVVTADELDPADLGLRCAIDGAAIQDDRTSSLRFSIPELVAYLSRHAALRPGDLIATGTPARLVTPPGPGRRLRAGDVVAAWIEGIGTLTTRIG